MNTSTLIITVGTRQIGWRCPDGIVRSLGADGGASIPPHINELYTLVLGQERGCHPDDQKWSVRHLGEQLYALCELHQSFNNVELLLDSNLIDKAVQHGLTRVILWGTSQPEHIPWKFRRFDTLWSAQLMAGKLRQLYPNLQVDVWCPTVAANDTPELCKTVEEFILQSVFNTVPDTERTALTLLIENKGSVPAIASALEMCAVALSRQCQVKLIVPDEPDPLFRPIKDEFHSAQISQNATYIPIGRYFWPLEKPKIISAWQRGDFGEARLWLAAHCDRYKALHDLAGYLQLASNWDIEKAIAQLQNQWLSSKAVKQKASTEQLELWKALAAPLQTTNKTISVRYLWTWERMFLYEIEAEQHRYSESFMRFALVLEAVLALQHQSEDWLEKQYLTPLPNQDIGRYEPGLGALMIGWRTKHSLSEDHAWSALLNRVRIARNRLAHPPVKPLKVSEILNILTIREQPSTQNFSSMSESETVCFLMQQVLKKVAYPVAKPPQDILLRSLYQWGLEQLNAES